MSDQPNLNYQNELSPYTNLIVKDVALKALLFAMVFYIMNSSLVNKLLQFLDKYQFIEKNFVQSILFGIVFYMISVNL
jgi:branched-subunit amino acid transport protein AzlD